MFGTVNNIYINTLCCSQVWIKIPLRAVEAFKRKNVGQTAVSDNQSSSVTLNKLAKEARKTYCNFEFQERSHTMTDINPTEALIFN